MGSIALFLRTEAKLRVQASFAFTCTCRSWRRVNVSCWDARSSRPARPHARGWHKWASCATLRAS